MIITVSKPFSEVLEGLIQHKSIFIVGCAACATKCQTGSEDAVKKSADQLEKEGKKITGSIVLDTSCDIRIAKKDLARAKGVESSDALLVLACGAGVGSIEKVINKPLIPGLNPVFVGTTERIGVYHEYCVVCGECMLGRTGGICPIARCAKGLLNGPCGGVINGKCETNTDIDCAWSLIYEKVTKINKDSLKEYVPPRKYLKPVVLKKM